MSASQTGVTWGAGTADVYLCVLATRRTCSLIQVTSLSAESSSERKSSCVLSGRCSTRLLREDSEVHKHSRKPDLFV